MDTQEFEGIGKSVRLLTRATALLYISLALVVLSVFFIRSSDLEEQTNQNNQARYALCALKEDLGRRIRAGETFLRNHPQGIPGITRTDLVRSINNQKETHATISPYLTDCPEGGEQ